MYVNIRSSTSFYVNISSSTLFNTFKLKTRSSECLEEGFLFFLERRWHNRGVNVFSV